MDFALDQLSHTQVYKLLTGLVVPRPIAWVSTLNASGSVNLAPFSFFNAIGTEPPLVVLGIGDHEDRPKDTARNIENTREFVVNLVDEKHAQWMSDSAAEFPYDLSEAEQLKIPIEPSIAVQTPRVAGCPGSIECVLEKIELIGANRIVFGRVAHIFVDDAFVEDGSRCHIRSEKLGLIGRMGGPGGYTKTSTGFQIARRKYPFKD